jgi:adhesin transport system membrane fusion protein
MPPSWLCAILPGEQAEVLRPLVEKGIEPRLSLVQARNAAIAAQSEADAAAATAQRARAALAEARASMGQQRQEWRAHAATDLAAAQGGIVLAPERLARPGR